MPRPQLHITCAVILLTLAVFNCGHAAELRHPVSIAVVSSDEIFLADRKLPGVWRFEDGKLRLFFRAGQQYNTRLNAVRCVELDRKGRLLVGDSATRNVYLFDEAGEPKPLTRQAGADGDPPVPYGRVGIPMDIAVSRTGQIFVCDLEVGRVLQLQPNGGHPQEVVRILGCRGLFTDAKDNLWVVSTAADQLHRISPGGASEVIVTGRPFEFPQTVVVDDLGNAYVCDSYAKTIWKVAPGRRPKKWCQDPALVQPTGMDIFDGTLYVTDPGAKAIFQINSAGQLTKLEIAPQQ